MKLWNVLKRSLTVTSCLFRRRVHFFSGRCCRWMFWSGSDWLFTWIPPTLTDCCVDLCWIHFHTFLPGKIDFFCVNGIEWGLGGTRSVKWISAGPLALFACGRMNELISSRCVSWIYSHLALWYPTSMGLLQVNDQLCEGPFARNMNSVKTSVGSRCSCHWAAHVWAVWPWRISFWLSTYHKDSNVPKPRTILLLIQVGETLDPQINIIACCWKWTMIFFSYKIIS